MPTPTVRSYVPWKDSGKCARCRGTLAAGDACEVVTADGYVEHRHADCEPSGDGAALGARLMADIRAGKPPANPHPSDRKVQGS